MGMNTTKSLASSVKPSIAAFSNDEDFVHLIQNNEFSFNESLDNEIDHSITNADSSAKDLADYDAIIYDLELAGGDPVQAKQDILHLKLASLSKPLVMVGCTGSMHALMNTENVAHLVDQTAAKPVVSNQLETVVESAIKGCVGNLPTAKAPRRNYTVYAFGSSFAALLFTAVALMTVNTSIQSTTSQSAETITPPKVVSE